MFLIIVISVDACDSALVLSSYTRAVSFYSESVECDGSLQNAWYRFAGQAGNQILSSCPEDYGTKFRCGTHAGGWLNGQHPTNLEGVVERMVCFAWEGSCCQWSFSMKIFDCLDYHIYKLAPVSHCQLRYCGNG